MRQVRQHHSESIGPVAETAPSPDSVCNGSGNCQHAHGSADNKLLIWALLIITGFAVVEVIGGLLSNSLALLADSGHMITDAVAIGLALWARMLAKAPATSKLPYGRTRAQVLAAFVNGLALFVLIGMLLWESFHRFSMPEAVDAKLMAIVAVIGLLANIAAFFILHSGNRDDINMRGAMLHVVGDMLGSMAAIISAIVIATTGWLAIDPVVTILVCALIAKSAFSLTRDAIHVLLQGAPKGLDVDALRTDVQRNVKEIESIHDLKVWMLTPDRVQLTMHAMVVAGADTNTALKDIKSRLADAHGIHSSIIQIEMAKHAATDLTKLNPLTEQPCPDDLVRSGGRSATVTTAHAH